MTQVLLAWINAEIGAYYKSKDEPTPGYYAPINGVVNSIFLILYGTWYGKLMKWMVSDENHRYQDKAENSMANKIYMFQFLNTYIGNFVAIGYK